MSLHSRIREARSVKGMTQADLANFIGVAKTTVAGWEKNREPNAAQIGAIAFILDTDVTFLFQDEVGVHSGKRQQDDDAGMSDMEIAFFKEFRKIPDSYKDLAASLCTALIRELAKHQTIETETTDSVPAASSH